MLKTAVIFFYFANLLILALFGIHRYWILFLYYRHRGESYPPLGVLDSLPLVTLQLPIYNEIYVVERLIDAVCKIDYPQDKLSIQVLDDSTDQTMDLVKRKVEEKRNEGFHIEQIHRRQRVGFKAGALQHGFLRAKGEFIAIFDADFIPSPDVLKKTIHYFSDPKVGMVQVRWGHLNRDYSLLTRVQSIFLDGHFMIHHTARYRSGMFFNFNGTAGVWRKSCIENSGGWQSDTLAEDVDLSYRSQLKGWKFVYLPDVVSPAELPIEMKAFKNQQHRWAKGAIQTARKVLPDLWRSPLPFKIKLESTFHLINNVGYLVTLFLFVLILPVMIYRITFGPYQVLWLDLPLFLAATTSFWIFYLCSQRELYGGWAYGLKNLFFLSCVGVGISVNNAKAVLEGLLSKTGQFNRTPKYNVIGKQSSNIVWQTNGFHNLLPVFELGLSLYFTFLIYFAFSKEMYLSLPFFVIFQVGFFYVGFLSCFEDKIHSFFSAKTAVRYV